MNNGVEFSSQLLKTAIKEFHFFLEDKPESMDPISLNSLINKLQEIDIDKIRQEEERIAFWINIYNALKIYLILTKKISNNALSHYQGQFLFNFKIGNWRFNLAQIKHGILRHNQPPPFIPLKTFKQSDERTYFAPATPNSKIIFALSDLTISSPKIAIYDAYHLDFQLSQAQQLFVSDNFIYDIEFKRLAYSPIFKWYAKDFPNQFLKDPQFVPFHKTQLPYNFKNYQTVSIPT